MSMRIEHNVFYGDAACGDDFYFNSDIGVIKRINNDGYGVTKNTPAC